jgi:hypothetical protein
MGVATRHFGLGIQTAYNLPVTVTNFLRATAADVIDPVPEPLYFGGIQSGLYGPTEDDFQFQPRVGGGASFSVALTTNGFKEILEHIFGLRTDTGTTPTISSAISVGPLAGKYMTAQVIKPFSDGSGSLVQTATGCKFLSANISCDNKDVVRLSATMDARNVTDATSSATATYITQDPLIWYNTTLTVSSVAVKCRGWEMSVTNALRTDNTTLANAGLKDEPEENGPRKITITLKDVAFESKAQYNNLISTSKTDRMRAISISCTSPVNTNQLLTIAASKAMYTGDIPGGISVGEFFIMQNLSFDLIYPSAGTTPVNLTYVHPT